MAKFDVDVGGVTYEVDAPDERTAWKWANATHKKKPDVETTTADKIAAFAPVRFAVGAAKPILGVAQIAANALPFDAPKGYVNDTLATLDEMTERGSKTRWGTGGEVADFAGQVLSPVNAGIAKALPIAGTAASMAGKGAAIGAVGAATNPVMNRNSQGNYWETKAADTAIGALTGGALSPVLGKLGEAIVRRLPKGEAGMARASLQTDQILREALAEIGQKIDDIPKAQYQQIRQQVNDALKSGKQLDAAAILRKADFDAVGMPSLAGQITRDATQFAKERNLRGVAGVGEPLQNVFDAQNKGLQSGIAKYSEGASDAVTAGERMAIALRKTDESLRGKVSSAYKAARESTGKDLEVPLQGLAQDAANVINDFAEKVPGGVRNKLAEYGIFGGKQTKVFTFEEADKLIKNINDHVGADPATNKALSALRDAVKRAMMDAPADDAYAAARNLASQRFKLHELVPALKAASEDSVAADAFVRKYITAAPTKDVRMMAELLRKTSPDALNEARTQIGQNLQRAAFGENVAGDKIFAPERFAKALREIGDKKLEAFFTPAEVAQMKQFSRVGAYINSSPAAAPVSSSNSNISSMVANYGTKLPGVGPVVSVGKAVAGPISNQRTVSNALASKIPVKDAPLSPEQIRYLSRILGTAAVGGGVAVAQ